MNGISPGISQLLKILFWDKPVDISISVYKSRDLNLHALGQHLLFSPVSYMAFVLYISPRSKAVAGISVVNLVPASGHNFLIVSYSSSPFATNNNCLCILGTTGFCVS